ncbi:MAG: T9SS type A sorting domain-containing protein [Bacteroidetes bacterium]|nr:T9SS type A sorting domain-containing protein [Bacteroidota bacterium]
MKLKLPLIATAICLSYGVSAQTGKIALKNNAVQVQSNSSKITQRTCGTEAPGAQWDAWFNKQVEDFKIANQNGKAQMVNYTIPVVVHVIHSGQAVGVGFNISQAQVIDQINILNADYAGTGLNNGNAPAVFSPLKANCNISFCLAQKNPSGVTLTEPGIDRVNAVTNGWSTTGYTQAYTDATIKPATIWDPTRYLNIWALDLGSGLLGYATFPAASGNTGLGGPFGTTTTDGVVILNKAIGSIGSAVTNAPYHKGRTTTHEVGHWLGLRHIWGDGNCLTDYCNDTPTAQQSNFGCPTHPYKVGVCAGNTTGEMFMNFMDYTDDLCMYMFTTDQRTRMQTTMANGTYRSQLTTSAATLCTIAAATPTAGFLMSTTGCVGSAVSVTNTTNGTPAPTYVWSSVSPTGVSFTPNNTASAPSINFTNPGTYSITVAATNSLGTNSQTKVITISNCAVVCADTLTNVSPTGTLMVGAAGSDTATPGCSPKAGYIAGSNCYKDKEKAEYFPTSMYSSIASPQIKSVIVLFYKNGTQGTGGTASMAVNMKLYTGTMAGGPTATTAPFGQVNANIGNIVAVTATNQVNYVGSQPIVYTNPIIRPYRYLLASPVNAPATNGFFASVTLPTTAGDTAVIFDDPSVATGTNWELWSDNTWHDLATAWTGYSTSLAILPEIQCGVTGINKNSVLDANVSLHPNPSNGLINIIATLPNAQNLEITVHNSLGQLISSTKHNGVTSNVFNMDLSSYSNGVYIVTINNGEEKIVKRLILNK